MTAGDLPGFLGGAGSTAAVMFFWLRSVIADRDTIQKKIEDSDHRERAMTAKMLEAIILNKTFLENHQGELSTLGQTIKEEVKTLVVKIETLADEINQERAD
jgi:hypothetical protein